ncbi:MAG: hypothetical protein IK147_00830, partial [Clostridia bacterium]|nr:hypothetical protein [Clostridia bacterium]
MGKIKKFIAVCAAATVLAFPVNTADAETNLLTNGNFNEYTTESSLFTTTYYVTGWTASEGVSVDASDTENLRFAVGSNMTITQRGVSLEAGTYRAGVKIKTAGEASVSFKLQGGTEYETAETAVENTNGEYREVAGTVTVSAGTYDFTICFKSVSDTCYADDAFLETYDAAPETDANLTTGTGASIRITGASGLRFYGSADKAYYDGFKNSHPEATLGMLIVPYDYLKDRDFSVESLKAAGHKYLEIQANVWNNDPTADGYYGFNCAITDIHTLNLDRPFAARTYLKYQDGGKDAYIYGDFNATNNVRSVSEVAKAAQADNGYYGSLSPSEKAVIDYYAEAIEDISSAETSYSYGVFTCTFTVESAGYIAFSYDLTTETSVSSTVATSCGEERAILGNAFEVSSGQVCITITTDGGPF